MHKIQNSVHDVIKISTIGYYSNLIENGWNSEINEPKTIKNSFSDVKRFSLLQFQEFLGSPILFPNSI